MSEAQRMAGFGANTMYRRPAPKVEWKSAWRLEFERRCAEEAAAMQNAADVRGILRAAQERGKAKHAGREAR